MAITKITGASIAADSIDGTKIADDAINSEHLTDGGIDDVHIGDVAATKLTGTIASGRLSASNLGSGTVPTARLGSGTASNTTFLRGDGSWQVVAIPKLDSPTITGTLAVGPELSVSHTISNYSDDVSYTITPTNCTVGSVNSSGIFVVTHTSGVPSYTIVATTDSLGLDDSTTVTKNLTLNLGAPTLSSPADVLTNTNLVYTITSTDSNDDKLILDLGSSNFTYGSVSHGSGSKVGNTVEVTGFTTNNPAVTLQFTAAATYSVTAKAVDTGGTYGDSASSSADSITISEWSTTGGTKTTHGSYTVHTFTSSGNLVITGSPARTMDYLVIAGGGGGGSNNTYDQGPGGAGAGGWREGQASIGSGTHAVVVGAGGSGSTSSDASGAKGSDSSFNSLLSTGGGGGGSRNASQQSSMRAGMDGGSGGGGAGPNGASGADRPSTSPRQGKTAGAGGSHSGGGGGGKGDGGSSGSGNQGGAGGPGANNSLRTGSSEGYCAGGGGGNGEQNGGLGGAGGSPGEGGAGARYHINGGPAGRYGSGGGGGGANSSSTGGNGSNGFVIIRYTT